jgi:hypothetical protein
MNWIYEVDITQSWIRISFRIVNDRARTQQIIQCILPLVGEEWCKLEHSYMEGSGVEIV